ncbi:MAG: hypothetical protein ABI876_14035 [Bacteroidota bacterium]
MTLAEFTITLHLRREEESGRTWTVFRVATVREFRMFRYRIQIDGGLDAGARTFDFRIHGVQAPTNLMPETGAAFTELAFPDLDGEYRVRLAGAKSAEEFSFIVSARTIVLLPLPAGSTLNVGTEKEVENVRQ